MAKAKQSRPATMEDAADLIHEECDASGLISFLLSDQPITREDREDMAALLSGGWCGIKVVIQRAKKGMPDRRRQRLRIYNLVNRIKHRNGGKMPPGAWDQVAKHFGLSRKAVESAYQIDAKAWLEVAKELEQIEPWREGEQEALEAQLAAEKGRP